MNLGYQSFEAPRHPRQLFVLVNEFRSEAFPVAIRKVRIKQRAGPRVGRQRSAKATDAGPRSAGVWPRQKGVPVWRRFSW